MFFRVLLVGFSLFRPGAARAPTTLNLIRLIITIRTPSRYNISPR